MGNFTSKAFEDLVNEELPQTPVHGKRVLTFDPRSPTNGITRTPIQVVKTPEVLDDPRSPTCGIPRTPIHSLLKQHEFDDLETSPSRRKRSLSEGSPIRVELVYDDTENITPALDVETPEQFNLKDDLQLIQFTSSDTDKSNMIYLDTDKTSIDRTGKTLGTDGRKQTRKTKTALFVNNTNIMETSEGSPRSPLRILSDRHQRSPMNRRKVDPNSPLSIVQRKQTNKLDLLKIATASSHSKSNTPCRFDSRTAEDKENLSM